MMKNKISVITETTSGRTEKYLTRTHTETPSHTIAYISMCVTVVGCEHFQCLYAQFQGVGEHFKSLYILKEDLNYADNPFK